MRKRAHDLHLLIVLSIGMDESKRHGSDSDQALQSGTEMDHHEHTDMRLEPYKKYINDV